jgi:DNA-binding NarL/FixJ family response regulator
MPDERAQAFDCLDAAIAEFEAMGMPPALAAARQLAAGTQARARSRLGLSQRQEEVLRLIAAGRTTREIAAQLVLSERTVERHIADVYAKIGARNRAEATAYALSRRD